MPPPINVLVCGYYGFANLGDEAILTVLVASLRRLALEITVVSGAPEQTAAEHDVGAVHWQDVRAIVAAAEAADLLVLGGGGLFQDHWPTQPQHILSRRHGNIDNYAGFALLARLTGRPLVVYGAGVGPLSSEVARRYTRLAFEQAGAVTVRSEPDLKLLGEIRVGGVGLGADPGFLLKPVGGVDDLLALEQVPDGRPRIGVTLRNWKGLATEALAAAFDRLVELVGAQLIFAPFHQSSLPHENDSSLASRVTASMRHLDHSTILRTPLAPGEMLAILGTCDAVVAMRLHGVIMGALAGAPVIALPYDPKVRTAMDDLGLGAFVVGLDEAGRVDSLVATALADRDRITSDLRERVAALRQRALENDAALERMVRRPSIPPESAETRQAIHEILLRKTADLEQQDDRLLEVGIAIEESAALRAEVARLERQRAELLGTKAMRATTRYWQARADLAEGTARGKRVLGRLLPGAVGERMRRPSLPLSDPIDPAKTQELGDRLNGELAALLAANTDAAGVVVYPPGIGWKVQLFQRPQQMALAFARLGYLVLYGLPPHNQEGVLGFQEVSARVHLMHVPDAVSGVLLDVPSPLVIAYVYNFDWSRHLNHPTVVYEHIDDLEVFTAAYPMGDLRGWHREALAQADLVVASAADLYEAVRSARPDALLVPNGVDLRHFTRLRPRVPPADLAAVNTAGRPVIGYYGALAEWVDYGLIEKAAQALTHFEFVFIGPDYDGSLSRSTAFRLANVHWLGVKSYQELPSYLACFDVATIPFLVNEVTHSVSPLKLFEYMAGGKPIVTPPLRECARYPGVQIGEGVDGYVEALRRAVELGKDPDHVASLRRTARANTWDKRAGAIVDAIARQRLQA